MGEDHRQTTIAAHCRRCGHEWESPFRTPMPIRRAVQVLNAITVLGCPKCGAHGDEVLAGRSVITSHDRE